MISLCPDVQTLEMKEGVFSLYHDNLLFHVMKNVPDTPIRCIDTASFVYASAWSISFHVLQYISHIQIPRFINFTSTSPPVFQVADVDSRQYDLV